MRNKKGVQINQMKRDLAQLLETGQDRTARIRVEHVIREEKMVAAYDLIEIYCELIVARMPIIESQKTCPIDLKEAVTSVIFATPRCSDISELADIKKQFTAKYGKEFVSAALELRPDSGVSRMLVEKLSAVAPDIQTKVKVLTGVAKEHNITWEPTSFEEKESKPPNDLLNGPANLETASMANPGPSKIQPSTINHAHKPDPPLDFAQQNRKYVVDNAVGTSSSGEGEQNWNMGFKDATSAAEAAAESAERAALAARAAAQFASQEKLPGRNETPHGEDRFRDSYESSYGHEKPKIINQQRDRSEHEGKDNQRVYEANNTRSSKSSSFTESKHELKSGHEGGFESENVNFFAEEASRKQPSVHSSISGYEVDDKDDREVGKRSVVGNPFAVVDQRNLFSESTKSKSDLVDQRADQVDDDDDDDGGPKFDTGFEYDEVESSTHSLENAHLWSPRKSANYRAHLFSESHSFGQHSVKSMEPLETNESVSASFDHSDSEIESEFTANPVESLPRKSRIELNDLVEGESSVYNDDEVEDKRQSSRQSSSILLKKHESNDEQSYDYIKNDLETEKELNFGTLTGGLRNKGGVLRVPPYTKTTAPDSSNSFKKPINESSKVSKVEDKPLSVSKSSSESDSDDYGDKFPVHSSNTRSRFTPPAAFFDDDDEDEKEVLKEAPSSVRLRSELSRRTRGSPSVSSSKSHYSHSDEVTEEIDSTTRVQQKLRNENQSKIRVNNHSINAKQEAIKKTPESGPTSRNSDESGKKENLGSVKPSYVHPKLPDYDTFAARLQTLRNERQ